MTFHVKHFWFVSLVIVPVFSISQTIGSTALELKPLPKLPAHLEVIESRLNVQSNYQQLDSLSKDWVYWTNYSRLFPKLYLDSVLRPLILTYPALKNENFRSLELDLLKVGPFPFLNVNRSLTGAAFSHAEDVVSNNSKLSHSSANGQSFSDRMRAANIIRCAGENISFGQGNTTLMLALLYLDNGVPDLGHRKSLLDSSFEEIGIGHAENASHQVLVVQDFACKQN